jgi:hypothetical protein
VAGAQLAYFVPEDPGYLDAVSNSFTAVDLGNSQKVRSLLTSAGVI